MLSQIFFIGVLCSLSLFWHPTTSASVCKLPAEPGICTGYFPKWYFNRKSKLCEEFIYGGCGGNANRFDTKDQCVAKCGCKLRKKVGPCKINWESWFFNKKTKDCEMFVYGGCRGNANRFDTEKHCQEVCDPCDLPSDSGPCLAYFERYYYISDLKKCKKFIYGGCAGNANNFLTKKACMKACKRS